VRRSIARTRSLRRASRARVTCVAIRSTIAAAAPMAAPRPEAFRRHQESMRTKRERKSQAYATSLR
jgi:hypothetical protein